MKNIHLGPTLPAFLSPRIIDFLVEHFQISGIQDVESDMKLFYPELSSNMYSKNMIVSEVLQSNPNAAQILIEAGFGCLGCPASQTESLEEACFVHGVDVETVLERLNNGE